jgi:flagellar protein FlhE
MMVHLCAESRCVALDGASGATRGLSNLAANQSLHCVYGVQGKGRLNRDLRVISNQVMVNYH